MPSIYWIALLLMSAQGSLQSAPWVQAENGTNQAHWGVQGGLQWAIAPAGFRPRGEPRGLIRIGYPILTNGTYDLINFIAVEPVVKGQKAFSELERSSLDDRQGKRFWSIERATVKPFQGNRTLINKTITKISEKVEEIAVVIRVEPFENSANVCLVVSQRSDAPVSKANGLGVSFFMVPTYGSVV